ncbi:MULTISPECIES: reverse transcriptase domain-containing protein [Burkholderia]|uniref:Reverse transcriptase (RNA-dependent DNA polymerase) n=1 Tax=Burkholderia pyrrocinia TaxID=60550 RepID=A0A318J4K6_BURPY|nr:MULTISPECIES: reverse transcriptase domain-containing protein [Burkholderia]PXX41257.1 reverse transcriptase (RNA-dependent DNA polymerase) [Burkholderia pyrrocinia]SFW82351.1 Reverse transcriptase (RNA-dependent DNA polymerase) [Burkholderia sp. NFACC33-1]SFY44022.1 Reverse transcriptase (RNA-dependent DNA polymerase) [Burkholderia sp. NFPP32]
MDARWDSKFELKPGKWVFVPNNTAIELGREIKDDLQRRWKAPSYFYHLRDGGHVAALKSHLGQSRFIHVDIRDFFGSINRSRVTRALKGLYSYDEAREIANLSTVRHPEGRERRFILPYGFVQSTLLASVCLRKSALGNFLKRISVEDGVVVSVYVDDIVISLNEPERAEEIFGDLKKSAEKSGFDLNEDKEQRPAERINAFNIELSQNSLQILPERWLRFLDAMRETDNELRQLAILGYVDSVNPGQAAQLQVSAL